MTIHFNSFPDRAMGRPLYRFTGPGMDQESRALYEETYDMYPESTNFDEEVELYAGSALDLGFNVPKELKDYLQKVREQRIKKNADQT